MLYLVFLPSSYIVCLRFWSSHIVIKKFNIYASTNTSYFLQTHAPMPPSTGTASPSNYARTKPYRRAYRSILISSSYQFSISCLHISTKQQERYIAILPVDLLSHLYQEMSTSSPYTTTIVILFMQNPLSLEKPVVKSMPTNRYSQFSHLMVSLRIC